MSYKTYSHEDKQKDSGLIILTANTNQVKMLHNQHTPLWRGNAHYCLCHFVQDAFWRKTILVDRWITCICQSTTQSSAVSLHLWDRPRWEVLKETRVLVIHGSFKAVEIRALKVLFTSQGVHQDMQWWRQQSGGWQCPHWDHICTPALTGTQIQRKGKCIFFF